MIPVNQPLLDGNEKKYLNECIDSGWISSEGPFVSRFESNLAAYVGRKHGVAVSNGSAALDLAFYALNLQSGDEVLMPSFTIISCASAVIRAGATPVFIDSDIATWNINIEQLEKNITNRTKAILVVHIYGLPCDMNKIFELAQKYKLRVIEDAAEMHGQTYYGKRCGSFGDISIFSFYPNKHITTGEGGMLLTDCDEIADRLRSARNLCFQSEKRFVHEDLGWNMRMTNLQAALGVAQLERVDEFIVRKRAMGALYQELLSDLCGIRLPLNKTEYAENIYWVFGIVIDPILNISAADVMRRLSEDGIGTRPFFWGMHEQPILKRMGYGRGASCPVSELLSRNGFYIPSGIAITQEQIFFIADSLRKILK